MYFMLAETAGESSAIAAFATDWLPLLLVIGVLVFLLLRSNRANKAYLDRAREHMDRLEAQAERTNQLLEKLVEDGRKGAG
jgi:hypothetical protein